MSPVIRSNWLLLAVAILLGLLIYSHGQRPQAEYTPITGADSSQINHILIRHKDELFAALRRQDDGWINLTSGTPVTDQTWVDKLLHIGQLPSLHHFPVAEHDLQAFGLLPPRYQLLLNDSPIHFGAIDPATGLRYIRVREQIHLISDSYTHYLSQKQDARTTGS